MNREYIVKMIENVEFTEEEMDSLGVVFFDNLEELPELLEVFGIRVTDFTQLIDHGLALSQVGNLSKPSWCLHSHDLQYQFIADMFNREGFYSISEIFGDKARVVVDKAYLREESFEEDIKFYLEEMSQREQQTTLRH